MLCRSLINFNCEQINKWINKCVTRPKLAQSYSREHKFRHFLRSHQSFLYQIVMLNPRLAFSSFFSFVDERCTLLGIVRTIDIESLNHTDSVLTQTLNLLNLTLLRSGFNMSCSPNSNSKIINSLIEYILSTKKFDEPLFFAPADLFLHLPVTFNFNKVLFFNSSGFSFLFLFILLYLT